MKLTTTLWFFSYHPIKVKLYSGLKYYTCLLRGHVWAIKPPDCESPEIICVRLYSGQTYQKQYTCWVKVHVQWCWQNHNSVILLKHICVSQSFELNSIGFLYCVFVLCFCFVFLFLFLLSTPQLSWWAVVFQRKTIWRTKSNLFELFHKFHKSY